MVGAWKKLFRYPLAAACDLDKQCLETSTKDMECCTSMLKSSQSSRPLWIPKAYYEREIELL